MYAVGQRVRIKATGEEGDVYELPGDGTLVVMFPESSPPKGSYVEPHPPYGERPVGTVTRHPTRTVRLDEVEPVK